MSKGLRMVPREPTDEIADLRRARRNLDPHAEAIAAMFIYGNEYARQNGGSMDFWDALPDHKKRICRALVNKIQCARPEKATP